MKVRCAACCVVLLLIGWLTGVLRAGMPRTKDEVKNEGEKALPLRPSEARLAVPATAECEDSWSLVATLDWGGVADWDLHLDTPNAHIYWNNLEDDGFALDRDAQPVCNPTPPPPEQITGNGQCGTYKVYRNLYRACTGTPPPTFFATVTALKPLTINGAAYNIGDTFHPDDNMPFTVVGTGCSIAPLTPLTDEASLYLEDHPVDIEHLTPSMRAHLAAFQSAVKDAGGHFELDSAFRTQPYQAHLKEVWDKWSKLNDTTSPQCQELKAQVHNELFTKHKLKFQPAGSAGKHPLGVAIDVSVNPTVTGLPTSSMVSIACAVGLNRRVKGDIRHFEIGPCGHSPLGESGQYSPSFSSPPGSKSTTAAAGALASLQIDVEVSIEDLPAGTARYRYAVSNNSGRDLVGLYIGYYNDEQELLTAPVGWDPDTETQPPDTESPFGWHAAVIPTEDVPYLSLQWRADSPEFGLPTGGASTSFAALLDARHDAYASTHWTAVLADGRIVSGQLINPSPLRLANISTRLVVETGDNALIGGFIVTGTAPKEVILRAIGPSLPLTGALADPVLELRDSSGGLVAFNDDWRSDQEEEIIATGIPPGDNLESAIVATLPANNSAYTAIVHGYNDGTGIGLVEAYDLDRTVDSKLANISTRGLVNTGDNVMIGGTIVTGNTPVNVLIRAIGPSLTSAGVPNALQDPALELRNGNGALIASNDNWRSDQEFEIVATTIPPTDDRESAILRSLPPGAYTAIVKGNGNSTGVAVVEAYQLDN